MHREVTERRPIFHIDFDVPLFVVKDPALEDVITEENESLVTALRNTLMPRLLDRDASVFITLLQDLWPNTAVPMEFWGSKPAVAETASQVTSDKSLSKSQQSRGGETTEPSNPLRSFRG